MSDDQKEAIEQPQPVIPPSSEAIHWAMVCHLSGFAGFLFPIANIIAPLLIWGFKRQSFPYLDEQGKEAINFQISISIYYLASILLVILFIGFLLIFLVALFHIIAMIIAAVETAHGNPFRYPLTIRFLR